MEKNIIDRWRSDSYLLPPPGGEVVRTLLDEIERLQINHERLATMLAESKAEAVRLRDLVEFEVDLLRNDAKCAYCDDAGVIETDNNGPIGPCPVCKRGVRAHEWDRAGERCIRCRAKDWMGGECTPIGDADKELLDVPAFLRKVTD